MSDKTKIPKYLIDLIKSYPNIKSGRKNFSKHHLRILNTIKLINKYLKKSNN